MVSIQYTQNARYSVLNCRRCGNPISKAVPFCEICGNPNWDYDPEASLTESATEQSENEADLVQDNMNPGFAGSFENAEKDRTHSEPEPLYDYVNHMASNTHNKTDSLPDYINHMASNTNKYKISETLRVFIVIAIIFLINILLGSILVYLFKNHII